MHKELIAFRLAIAVVLMPGPLAAEPVGHPASDPVWQLRTGLSVAATTCRGRGNPSLAEPFRRLLARHKSAFAAANAAEQRRLGRHFDDEQARLNNRFFNQRGRRDFCRTALDITNRATAMSAAELTSGAAGLVAELEARLL